MPEEAIQSSAANGIAIRYREDGQGTPAILLHGSLDCTGAMWQAQAARLGEACRLVVPDLRGHGRWAELLRARSYAWYPAYCALADYGKIGAPTARWPRWSWISWRAAA